MTTHSMQDYLSFAHVLADAAGNALRRRFRRAAPARIKADGSPVTEADREAETAMRALIRTKYPQHGIFGEEEGCEQESAALQWVLDPIDGTRPFLAGYPTFTTLIALLENGVPVLGIIDQPILRERWAALRGGITELNGAPVRTAAGAAAVATTSLPYFNAAQAAQFQRAAQGRTAVHGGDAYAYAMLASGQLQAVLDAHMKPYDFCALAPVVAGAGGVITDWRGKPLTLHSGGEVLAACDANTHAEILGLLSHSE